MSISVSPEGLCAAQRGPLSAVGRRPVCSQRVLGSPLPRPRARSGGSFPCHGDALKSLACGNAGVLTVVNFANATAAAAGTVTSAQASPGWLGHHAMLGQIRQSGLWNVEHVTDPATQTSCTHSNS